MSCDLGEVAERLENELSKLSVTSPTSQLILQLFRPFTYITAHSELILQPFHHFTYVTTHSPNLPSLYLRHSSFSNPSIASLTSQIFFQPFLRFSYVTSSSLNSPGEPPMLCNACILLYALFTHSQICYQWSVTSDIYKTSHSYSLY